MVQWWPSFSFGQLPDQISFGIPSNSACVRFERSHLCSRAIVHQPLALLGRDLVVEEHICDSGLHSVLRWHITVVSQLALVKHGHCKEDMQPDHHLEHNCFHGFGLRAALSWTKKLASGLGTLRMQKKNPSSLFPPSLP